MAKIPITVLGYRCERCAHEWVPTSYDLEPSECPKCHSSAWNKPKGPMLTYDDFSAKISDTLRTEGGPLTWTEIRTRAGLPQKFPNNEWVRRLERDIGLTRVKDSHGIINWAIDQALIHG
jgi:hypothetical protein